MALTGIATACLLDLVNPLKFATYTLLCLRALLSRRSITASIEATPPIDLININPSPCRLCHQWKRMKRGEATMKAGWKVFWSSMVVLAVAYGLAQWLVPDVVPVGYSEQPQPSWAVLTAFALRSIELTAAWVAVIALTLLCGAWALGRLRGRPARLTR